MSDPTRETRHTRDLPDRLARPDALSFTLYVAVAAFVIWCFQAAEMSVTTFVEGIPSMGRLAGEMFPPAFGRMESIGATMLETFQMAVVGTVLGVALSIPFAVMAARNQTPNKAVYYLARGVITFMRTVPDLIWAIFFVITVGLGPFAGVLALTVDTLGFCGRFFAETMEEADPGPQEALSALGARRSGIILGAVLPAAMPSMVATSLFALEKATRSSVVLGLVGAGGIGIELKAAMDMFDYNEAATIILSIFALVIVVERTSAALRARLI
ncbi:phosphonate ABC transporter, permease protein PhnE [Rhodovibrio salinarum]|uniref:Phosphonate ABC transporter, permease protein PhnE n=1 Tax=Rhodovibrio salinarum TaxID=1087 RepID=A0A934QKR9_9PROT|nr:phosphonate ABC transporter, permease protein PhnE [Rhodovibrio salinarum]MBK1698522.1 phosphonate ABC transporter, permease protein PhnE [Rhodovibrio salinarum]